MAIERVTVDRDGATVARCPACDGAVRFESTGRRVGTPVRTLLRCPCGRRFAVLEERRAAVRRQVSIPAAAAASRSEGGRPVTILNLSRTGVLFSVGGGDPPAVGETLWIRFALDAASGPSYHLRGRVVRIEPRGVAAEFVDLKGREAAAYDLALALLRSAPGPS